MICPNCKEPLVNHDNCDACGWTPQRRVGPPQVQEQLRSFLGWWTQKNRLPKCMPHNIDEAARWWLTMQEPPDEYFERPRKLMVTGSKQGTERWESSYTLRVLSTLQKFLSFSEQNQRIIVAACKDKIWWRGESLEHFYKVISQIEHMHKVGLKQFLRDNADAVAEVKKATA